MAMQSVGSNDGNADTPSGKAQDGHDTASSSNATTLQAYFLYYSKLSNQMNMLQDTVRTTLYHRAITSNRSDFEGKVAMDVGAGTGILSFFAAEAGARRVFAVEASRMAEVAQLIVNGNPGLGSVIRVIGKPLEEITLLEGGAQKNHGNSSAVGNAVVDEQVDVLVSEPIGTFLFNERMIETYLEARDRFLKPGGKMFPNRCKLCLAPFSDPVLFKELAQRHTFWNNRDFFGVDLSAASEKAIEEQFCLPIVDYIDPACLLSPPHVVEYDLETIPKTSLREQMIPFEFVLSTPCLVHGLAGWFDISFEGSDQTLGFSTSPWCPPTHWYQIRFVLRTPLAVNAGQVMEGELVMKANAQQSYTMDMRIAIQGTSIASESRNIDLKDPEYRYYTSSNTYYPPGAANTANSVGSTNGGMMVMPMQE